MDEVVTLTNDSGLLGAHTSLAPRPNVYPNPFRTLTNLLQIQLGFPLCFCIFSILVIAPLLTQTF